MAASVKPKHAIPHLILSAVLLWANWPLLQSLERVTGCDDWTMRAARHAAFRESLLRFRQFPLRTPYFGGGYPSFADPEDSSLNPLTLLTVIFGEVAGLKLVAMAFHAAGAFGVYWLCFSVEGCGAPGALIAAVLFACGTWLPSRHFSGNTEEMQYMMLPWLLLLLHRSRRSLRWTCALSVVLALMLTDGKLCWAVIVLGLAFFALWDGVGFEKPRRLCFDATLARRLVTAVLLAVILAAVKTLPVIELLTVPRPSVPYTFTTHAHAYSPGFVKAAPGLTLAQELIRPHIFPPSYDASGCYAGPLALAVAALCGVLTLRASARWLAVAGLAFWLAMAHEAPFDLLRLLCALPVFANINLPVKYFDFFIFLALCVLWGRLPGILRRWLGTRAAAWAAVSIAAINVAPAASVVREINSVCFRVPQFAVERVTFHHVRGVQIVRSSPRPSQVLMYPNVRRGVGTLDSFLPIRVSERAAPRFLIHRNGGATRNSAYRGETYFDRPGNRAEIELFTPNRIHVRVDVFAPGRLIVNQNFERHWKANAGRCVSADGVLAVDLAKTGTYVVRFRYAPTSFYAGLAVSLIAFGILFSVLARRRPVWLARALDRHGPTATVRLPMAVRVRHVALAAATVWVMAMTLGPLWARTIGATWRAEDAVYEGQSALDLGQRHHAIALFREALRIRPDHSLSRIRLGQSLAAVGAFEAAAAELRRAARAPGTQTAAEAALATTLGTLGRRDEAAAACQRSLQANPYQPNVWAYLAALRAAKGQTDSALSAVARSVELGFSRRSAWLSRREFDTLRGDPRFVKLLGETEE